MAFSGIKFCGLSVMDVKSSLGWNGQTSSLTVQLVADTLNGDVLNAPEVGQPIYFGLGDFKFYGILQKFSQTRDTSGNPTYTAYCTDPREILANAKVILGAYSGDTGPMVNLINVFGWWENRFGFGASLCTDAGMPWSRIFGGINDIINIPNNGTDEFGRKYGEPLSFRGYTYAVDLTELPVPPLYYRIGGTDMSLLDLIDKICKDSGHDYFVELVGLTIRVRTTNLGVQKPLGQLEQIVDTNYGNVIRNEVGYECANETTSYFLVGGEKTTIYETDQIANFWGYDIDNNPIVPSTGWKFYVHVHKVATPLAADILRIQRPVFAKTAPVVPEVDKDKFTWIELVTDIDIMDLNGTGVEDILGQTYYSCSTLEMRFALAGIESWSSFLHIVKPEVHRRVFNEIPLLEKLPGVLQQPDNLNDNKVKVKQDAQAHGVGDAHQARLRMYQFVKGYAEDYYGKVFIVQIPFVLRKTDTDTQQVIYSANPTTLGYAEESDPPLDLSADNQDIFADTQGRFGPMALYALDAAVDVNSIPAEGTVIQQGSNVAQFEINNEGRWKLKGDRLYTKFSVEEQIVYIGEFPYVIVQTSTPVTENPRDYTGDVRLVGGIMNHVANDVDFKKFKASWKQLSGGYRVSPVRRRPALVGIPLRSNILTYGPWYVAGNPGKVEFRYDSGLVPWNYGGYVAMNAAANAEVSNISNNMQISEAGSIELTGMPSASLGDVLQTGGPNITDISISYGVGGVNTSYRFQSFTPRFGVMAKAAAEKIRHAALNGYRMRTTMRQGFRELQVKNIVKQRAKATADVFKNLPKFLKKNTPHDVLWGHAYYDNETNVTRVHTSSVDSEEALTMVGADDADEFQRISLMGWSGLIRPFTTKPAPNVITPSGTWLPASGLMPDSGVLPRLSVPSGSAQYGITSSYYNPFQAGNDMQIMLWGSGDYQGVKAYRRQTEVDHNTLRGLALRGPLLMTGWGWGIDGKYYPTDSGGNYVNNTMRRSDLWKTGPVDHLWDDYRGVWTSHDVIVGKLIQPTGVGGSASGLSLPANGSGYLNIQDGRGSNIQAIQVWNHFNAAVSGEKNAMAGYVAHANRWYVIAVDC